MLRRFRTFPLSLTTQTRGGRLRLPAASSSLFSSCRAEQDIFCASSDYTLIYLPPTTLPGVGKATAVKLAEGLDINTVRLSSSRSQLICNPKLMRHGWITLPNTPLIFSCLYWWFRTSSKTLIQVGQLLLHLPNGMVDSKALSTVQSAKELLLQGGSGGGGGGDGGSGRSSVDISMVVVPLEYVDALGSTAPCRVSSTKVVFFTSVRDFLLVVPRCEGVPAMLVDSLLGTDLFFGRMLGCHFLLAW